MVQKCCRDLPLLAISPGTNFAFVSIVGQQTIGSAPLNPHVSGIWFLLRPILATSQSFSKTQVDRSPVARNTHWSETLKCDDIIKMKVISCVCRILLSAFATYFMSTKRNNDTESIAGCMLLTDLNLLLQKACISW